MSKKQNSHVDQLKMPLMTSLQGGASVPVDQPEVVPMEHNSPVELTYFEQAMLGVVKDDLKADPRVKQSIDSIYSAYYGVVNATRVLAIAVYDFCNLTGCEYSEVSSALSKGLQKQLDKSWISKLYHAGKVMSLNPVSKRITDIAKLALIGRLDNDQIKTAIVEVGGQAMIGDKHISLMKRDEFANSLAAIAPDKFQEPKAKSFNAKGARDTIESWISQVPTDTELTSQFKAILATLDLRIKAAESATLAKREAAKVDKLRAKLNELQATA